MMTRSGRVLVRAVVATACLLASGTWLMAQTTTASVQGTVRDTQGGAVGGAQVVLTSTTQGNAFTATTDTRGNFVFAVVRPDTYTLRISMTGFKTVEMTKVVVSANDKYNAGVTTLEVSSQQEVVTVVGRAPEIQASSGERSYTLESTTVQSIAVNDRSVFSLMRLVPGVKSGISQGGPNSGVATGISFFSANGARTNSNNITIDGVTNIDTGDNGTAMVTFNLDTVAEFKVLTSDYQAEYGRAMGAQMQVVTKSGGQDFSGAAYWYARRNKWNANNWLNNRNGRVRDETAKRNDRGINLGGPLFIPNGFNADKKKLFFFASLEMQRRNDPVNATNVRVPTDLERQGDFSQSVFNGHDAKYIKDYSLALAHPDWGCSATDTRACFQDGGVVGRIPQDRLYGPGLAILSLYPDANVNGVAAYNYTSALPADQPVDQISARLDYHINDSWRVMGRYMHNSDPNWQPLGVSWAAGGNVPMQGYRHLPGYNWMVSLNGAINDSTSLEMQLGSAHNYQEIGSDDPNLFTANNSQIAAFPLLYPEASTGYIPRFNWGNGGSLAANGASYYTQQAPFVNWNTTIDGIANITKVASSHVIKGGLYFQQSKKPQSPFASFNGQISFQEGSGSQYDTGNPYANAAIGAYNSFQQASRYAYPMYKYVNFEAYIQDNWKASRRLTLDYGVRFYMATPQDDAETKLLSNFFPNEWSASAAPSLYAPVCVGAYPCDNSRRAMDPRLLAQGATPTMSNTIDGSLVGRLVPGSGDPYNGSAEATTHAMFSGNAYRISPRFGFTYDLNGRQTAILRGAFGIFYDRPQGNTRFNMVGNPPGSANVTLNNGLVSDLATAEIPLSGPSGSQPSEYDFTLPMSYAWNFGGQFRLPGSFVLDVSYVGNKQTKLLGLVQINAIPYGSLYQPANQDLTRTPSAQLGNTALPTDLLRPYQGYGAINLWKSIGESNYNALQTTLQRRFDSGLMVALTYTFSKTLGTGSADYSQMRIDGKDREYNYGILQSDQPHNFVANIVYQTPKVAEGALGVIANGWQISGVYQYATGYPFQIQYGFDDGTNNAVITGSGQGARVVVVGDPGSGSSSDPYAQFNVNAFGPPSPNSIGAESSQFFLRQAPVNNLDLSLSKSFQLVGRSKFEIRLDAFNALNHMQIFSTNNSVRFAGLGNGTITNAAYDASGNLTNTNGFGSVANIWPGRQIQVVGRFTF